LTEGFIDDPVASVGKSRGSCWRRASAGRRGRAGCRGDV